MLKGHKKAAPPKMAKLAHVAAKGHKVGAKPLKKAVTAVHARMATIPHDKKWEAEQDARTLKDAAMIHQDKPRHSRARAHMANEMRALQAAQAMPVAAPAAQPMPQGVPPTMTG